MSSHLQNVLGLDIGTKRTGVARVNMQAKLPEPIGVIDMSHDPDMQLTKLLQQHDAQSVVVGLPLNMNSEETAQTTFTRGVISSFKKRLPDVAFFGIDEVGTSKLADERIISGVSRDELAAISLLNDFMTIYERGELENVSL